MRKINRVVMILAGLLLIAASILKFQEMLSCVPSWEMKAALWLQQAKEAGTPMPAWQANLLGFWESYEWLLIQIPLEFGLGVWLVSGLFRKAAWIAGTLAYFGFIIVTLIKAITGAASCGCFGQIHVDPWLTLFAIDIPFFLLLAIFRPKGEKLLPPPWPNVWHLLLVAVPTIVLMVLAAPMLVTFRAECLTADDQQPDPAAMLKVQVYKLNQQLQQQTKEFEQLQISHSLQGQSLEQKEAHVQTLQQTLEQKDRLIATLREQIEKLRQAVAEQGAIPAEPNIPEPQDITPVEQPEPNEPADATPPAQPDETAQTQQTTQAEPTEPAPEFGRWDWLQYVVEDEIREQLSTGLVAVLMYHHDCSDCAVMVPQYNDYYNEMLAQGNEAFNMAFLAIPPYGEGPVPEDTQAIHGKLTDEQDWMVTSPYVVVLLDGMLLKTWPQGTAPEPDKILEAIDQLFAQ